MIWISICLFIYWINITQNLTRWPSFFSSRWAMGQNASWSRRISSSNTAVTSSDETFAHWSGRIRHLKVSNTTCRVTPIGHNTNKTKWWTLCRILADWKNWNSDCHNFLWTYGTMNCVFKNCRASLAGWKNQNFDFWESWFWFVFIDFL